MNGADGGTEGSLREVQIHGTQEVRRQNLTSGKTSKIWNVMRTSLQERYTSISERAGTERKAECKGVKELEKKS